MEVIENADPIYAGKGYLVYNDANFILDRVSKGYPLMPSWKPANVEKLLSHLKEVAAK